MIDVERIGRMALSILRIKYGIPDSGFIAGASISNTMWEIVSGTKSVINDIDVFLHEDTASSSPIYKSSGDVKKVMDYDPYGQINEVLLSGERYTINESSKSGFINTIKYQSTKKNPSLILESFDINSTKIGYSIEEDKLYWTKDFEDFIKRGELRVVNLNTPSHTAIRLVKKSNELKIDIPKGELEILQFATACGGSIRDISRLRFMEKYADAYRKYESILSTYFSLKEEQPSGDNKIYKLVPTVNHVIDKNIFEFNGRKVNASKLLKKDLLYFVRNISSYDDKFLIWEKLYTFFDNNDYINCNFSKDDVILISSTIEKYPLSINTLRGLNIEEQSRVIKSVFSEIPKYWDYETAQLVIQNSIFYKGITFEEDDCLILGLSVRKKRMQKAKPSFDMF